jgi:hypothetical protein
VHSVTFRLTLEPEVSLPKEAAIANAAPTEASGRSASARAFLHSLNILVKYTRLYGTNHKRTDTQFETTWRELQEALPKSGDTGFVLGVSDSKLLLDGIPLEPGQAERSFAQLLNAAGLSSILFSSKVTLEDFTRLVRAFSMGGSKAQDFAKQMKETLGESKDSSIRINEVKFVAADPATGELSMAAQLAAQSIGPEFKQWLNDPQKLLQLIAAAQGASEGGSGQPGGAPLGTVPNVPVAGAAAAGPTSAGPGSGGSGAAWTGGVVPLQEEEVIQTIRLLTHFGKAMQDPNSSQENLKEELGKVPEGTKVNLAQLLESLAAQNARNDADPNNTPLLMKAAESMAIKFALDRYQKGDVKVNAVHDMMEHLSRQMDTLRQILRVQEDKMSKAGILVESHADILDRMFWAEIPESGKKSVLLSGEAACVPPRNIRQFVEVLFDREDFELAGKILSNYCGCLNAKEAEPRRKTAVGLSQLADLYAGGPDALMPNAIALMGEKVAAENDSEIQSLLERSRWRALDRKHARARNTKRLRRTLLLSSKAVAQETRPALAQDLRSRVGVENRLPEMIEEGDQQRCQCRKTICRSSARTCRRLPRNIFADRFFRSQKREECDRIIDLVSELGQPAYTDLREMLEDQGQPRQAASAVGLLSRLDVRTRCWNFCPAAWPNSIAFIRTSSSARSLTRTAPGPRTHAARTARIARSADSARRRSTKIGMSQDRSASGPLDRARFHCGESESRSPFVQLKAIESLGRLREVDAVPILRGIVEDKKFIGYSQHRELRIAACNRSRRSIRALARRRLPRADWRRRSWPSRRWIPPLDVPGFGSAATSGSFCRGRCRRRSPVRGENRIS